MYWSITTAQQVTGNTNQLQILACTAQLRAISLQMH